jgi:hypothetical protein
LGVLGFGLQLIRVSTVIWIVVSYSYVLLGINSNFPLSF